MCPLAKASPEIPAASIIIPVCNAARHVAACLESLKRQNIDLPFEIIVVDDGSTDETRRIVSRFPRVRLYVQANQGPAIARNLGASEARSEIILFTDADCRPCTEWLAAMLEPFFEDPSVVGVRGAYCTEQTALVPRLIQYEYNHRYKLLKKRAWVDYIGAYSAAYRRKIFLANGGFSELFRQASSEDGDLSYRLSAKGLKLVFSPKAVVKHFHPDTLVWYWRRKYKYAYWRMLAFRQTPSKMISDSHTPQLMKLQVLTPVALVMAAALDMQHRTFVATPIVLAAYLVSVLPFSLHIARKDPAVAALVPVAFLGRAAAQLAGAVLGTLSFTVFRRQHR